MLLNINEPKSETKERIASSLSTAVEVSLQADLGERPFFLLRLRTYFALLVMQTLSFLGVKLLVSKTLTFQNLVTFTAAAAAAAAAGG